MKKRVNISIDNDVYEESKEYIHNLSRFLEKCIKTQIEREKQKINQLKSFEEMGLTNEEINQLNEKRNQLYEIANAKWLED